MSPFAQRIAIGSICGWRPFPFVVINGKRSEVETWIHPHFVDDFDPWSPHAGCYAGALPPEYTTDLNAMAAAESIMNFSTRRRYFRELQGVRSKTLDGGLLVASEECILSTAAQRAEAFLKAHNIWEEDELDDWATGDILETQNDTHHFRVMFCNFVDVEKKVMDCMIQKVFRGTHQPGSHERLRTKNFKRV